MGASGSGEKIQSVLAGRLRIDHANNRLIVAGTDNVDMLLAGVDEDGEVRVKLARPGVDVKDATDEELVWSSDFNSFKIVDTGIITVTKGASASSALNSVALPADLDYVPGILAFLTEDDLSYQQLPYISHDASTGLILTSYRCFIDQWNIWGEIVTRTSGATFTNAITIDIRYYLLRETAG